jgi:tRNA(fMet)-specific endonuclease VapC
VALIDRAEWIGVPAIVLGELRVGFRLGRHHDRNEATLAEFLANPVVEELPVEGEVARHYAEIVIDLRRIGTPIPTNDVWIAATAASRGAVVLSCDSHFEAITRVGSVVVREG